MSNITRMALTCTGLVCLGAALAAQGTAPAKPMPPMEKPQAPAAATSLVESMKFTYAEYKGYFIAAAAEMPLDGYGFRPQTLPAADHKEVRTYSQLIGHMAEENFLVCAAAEGKAPPAGTTDIEQAKDGKAELTKALGESFAFCDRVWAATSDKNAGSPVEMPFNLGHSTRLGVLMFSAAHNAEHYGNVVTYLRAKGLVPPSSQPGK
jgi:uncharacterized damage-inducible protein DinB